MTSDAVRDIHRVIAENTWARTTREEWVAGVNEYFNEVEAKQEAKAVAEKFNDWRNTIDLSAVRTWYLFIPGDGTPFNEIVDDYEGMRSILHQYYVDPYDIITVPGELEE